MLTYFNFLIIMSCTDNICSSCVKSRRFILFISTFALFIDNLLLTIVVPIIPNVLREYELRSLSNGEQNGFSNNQTNNQDLSRGAPFVACYNSSVYSNASKCGENNNTNGFPSNGTGHQGTEPISDNSVAIGLLLATKPLAQLTVTVFIGKLINRIGYSVPMFMASAILFTSSVIFAVGETYLVLLLARLIHGFGSSLTTISCLGILAFKYPDDDERGKAMTFSIAGLSFGLLGGPIIGGVFYQYIGKELAFFVIAGMVFVLTVLEIFALIPQVKPTTTIDQNVKEIYKDPYIIIAAGSITIEGIALASVQATLPVWMYQTMNSNALEQGLAFTPCDVSYLIGSGSFGAVANKIGRWVCSLIGLVIVAIVTFAIPYTKDIFQLIAPMAGLGLSVGMVEVSMIPLLGYIVDIRHTSVYGSVYSVVDLALAIGYLLGPSVSGFVVEAIGFQWLMWIIAIGNLLYSPLLFFVRNPPYAAEKQLLIPKNPQIDMK